MIEIAQEQHKNLFDNGVACSRAVPYHIPLKSIFEPPCHIGSVVLDDEIQIGAFSSLANGYIREAAIGRYCTIDEGVQIGRGSHPIWTASSSPILYGSYKPVLMMEDERGELWNSELMEENKKIIEQHYSLEKEKKDSQRSFKTNKNSQATSIGNDVSIGFKSIVMPGLVIGDGAVIQPLSVVTKDVPDFAIVEGSPARIIGYRFDEDLIAEYQKVRWWRYAFWNLRKLPNNDPAQFLDCVVQFENVGIKEYYPNLVSVSHL